MLLKTIYLLFAFSSFQLSSMSFFSCREKKEKEEKKPLEAAYNDRNKTINNLLFNLAARTNDISSMEIIYHDIQRLNQDINQFKDNGGHPILHSIVRANCFYGLKFLVNMQNIKINLKNFQGQTAIMLSNKDNLSFDGYNFSYDICKLLIEKGADVNAKDKKGRTVLMHHADEPKVVDLLLSNRANPYEVDDKGQSLLDYIYFHFNDYIASRLRLKVASLEEATKETFKKTDEFNKIFEKHNIDFYLA